MKPVVRFLCVSIVSIFIGGAVASVSAQTTSPTPDPFVAQITQIVNASFTTSIGDISANGRFVVFTSNGDLSTEKLIDGRNNADGNREIFLFDYAQRRIFQITNTKNVPNPISSPSPSPSPSPTASPSPTPTPAPTPADLTQVKVEIANRSPLISLSPPSVGGLRTYSIVFTSNAPNPANFNGSDTIGTDGNSEIWVFRLPALPDVDLTLGSDLPRQDLVALGTLLPAITNTPASRAPTAGAPATSSSLAKAPFFADDNRDPAISDDGNILAFISTADLVPSVGNADRNPELFFYNISAGTFTQGTHTQDATPGIGLTFQSNPSLSSDGSVVAFVSSANLASNNADLNAEIFVANFSGSAISNIRQVTRTQNQTLNTNILSPGRRLSRNGALIAFESLATDPKANAVSSSTVLGMFVYTIATDTFVEIGTRPTTFSDIIRFPTFTDYNGSLAPSSLIFASASNFRPDGTIPTDAQRNEGLNPQITAQIFMTAIPASTTQTFVRLTNTPALSATGTFGGTLPVVSETHKRVSFVLGGVELGGGNGDFSQELFYLLSPIPTVQSSAALSFFTGASEMPVAAATPAPSPTPSPTPTPSPSPGAPLALAPGELSIVRSTVSLAPSDADACTAPTGCASLTERAPALPIELNGVSLSVNGAAAGLYSVRDANKQINFVVPVGAQNGLNTVAVNILNTGANTDTMLHGLLQIVVGQPDIFTSSNGPGGRAAAFDATTHIGEPFTAGQTIELSVTGIHFAAKAEITVTVGTTTISGDDIVLVQPHPDIPGFDVIQFKIPASLAGAGDVPIQVSFTRAGAGANTTSRPADTAPHITIN